MSNPMIHTSKMRPVDDGGGSIHIPAGLRVPVKFPAILYHKSETVQDPQTKELSPKTCRVLDQAEADAAKAKGYLSEPPTAKSK